MRTARQEPLSAAGPGRRGDRAGPLARPHDLAELYFEQGRTAEVKVLADTTCTALESLDVPPEAARAARLFAKATAAERLTTALLGRLRRGLER